MTKPFCSETSIVSCVRSLNPTAVHHQRCLGLVSNVPLCKRKASLRWQCFVFVCPAGGGSPEGAAAAHQAAKGSTEETTAERRSQSCDKIKEREPKHHQVKHRGRLLLGMNGTAFLQRSLHWFSHFYLRQCFVFSRKEKIFDKPSKNSTIQSLPMELEHKAPFIGTSVTSDFSHCSGYID